MSFRIGALILVGCVTNASPAAIQAIQKTEPPVFGAFVTLVAVPVFVTDKNGKAVAGLKAEDFEVEDGGKRVPIVAFQAVDVDAPATPQELDEHADLPVAMQAEAPRQILLLIDQQFSPKAGLFFSRKAALAYVRDSLAPRDLVAVATSGPSGIRMRTNFTSDHAYVARMIGGTGSTGSIGSDPLGLSGGVPALGGANASADSEFAEQDAAAQLADADIYRHQVRNFLASLLNLVQALSPLRGRKQIVLLSGGFSQSVWDQAPGKDNRAEGEPLFAVMQQIFRAAGEADVVIHAVSLMGIEGPIDLGSPTGQRASRSVDGPPTARSALNEDSGRGTLFTMAKSTGGSFILPSNNYDRALREVDQISRHSYVIAFEAADPGAREGKPRSLKVRVRRGGLSVSHRPTYAPPSPVKATDAAVRAQATEAISKGLSGGALRLHLATLPYRDQDGKTSVHVVLQVDGAALSEAAQGKELAVQVYGYAMREGGALDSLSLNTSFDLARSGDAIRRSGLRVVTVLPVSPGPADLRFFVRTGASGLTGSIQRNVMIPAFTGGQTVLSAPLFTAPIGGRVVVPFQPANRPHIEVPFRLGGEAFVPETSVSLASGWAREVCVFVWRSRTGPTAPLEVTGEIVKSGMSLPLRIEGPPKVVSDPDGFDRYVFTVAPPEAPPGAYSLGLSFRDPSTGLVTRTETGITLRK
jgi:VWFA-related protein